MKSILLSRAEMRRQIRDNRKRWIKRALWLIVTVTAAGWLWEWTGTPGSLE